MDSETNWHQKQLNTARQLVEQGSKALREGRSAIANGALKEARAIIDMAEEPDVEIEKLRAQILNELGFLHQQGGDTEGALALHEQSAAVCNQLIEDGVEFRANAAATHINLASLLGAKNDLAAARNISLRATELVDSLLEDRGDEADTSVKNLAFGAHQTLAMISAQNGDLKTADASMERALGFARELFEGSANVVVQAAQGVQQVAAHLFNAGEHDLALKWGLESEELARDAFEKLGQQALPIYVRTQLYLITFRAKAHQFAEAEDALWNALDVAGDHPQLMARGKQFYEQCRKQADSRLEEGGLPRDEVEEGLAEIEAKIESFGGVDKLRAELERLEGQPQQA